MTRAEGPAGAPPGCGGCCWCYGLSRPRGGWPWSRVIEEMSPLFQGGSPRLWNQNGNQNTAFSLLRARLSQRGCATQPLSRSQRTVLGLRHVPFLPSPSPCVTNRHVHPRAGGAHGAPGGRHSVCQNGPAGPSASPSSAFPPLLATAPTSVSRTAAPQPPEALWGPGGTLRSRGGLDPPPANSLAPEQLLG